MKSRHRTCTLKLIALLWLIGVASLQAQQPTGQWDFNSSNLNATVGQALTYIDGAGGATQQGTQFGTTTALGIPDIGGTPAQVMKFPACTNFSLGYSMPTPSTANGGGGLVNEWTVIMDILFTGSSDRTVRGLMDVDSAQISADAELLVNAADQLGVGSFFGTIKSNTWHRVGFVAQTSSNRLYFYIDGVQVGFRDAGGAQALDGRWALSVGATASLFNDDDGQAAPGYVNSIQLRDSALSKSQMAALGGPQSAGVPTTLPPIPSFIDQWIPAGAFASRDTAIGAVVDPGSTTIQDSSISLTLDGQGVLAPSITRAGSLITVRKDNPGPFTPGTSHTVILTLTDSLVGQKRFTNTFEIALLVEDFEGLALGGPKDEAGLPNPDDNLHVWTNRPPAGWTVDNSQFPATVITVDNPDGDGDGFADNDGRTEWAGWSFAKKAFWLTADDQRRSEFNLANGTVAIADPDEWDDQAHLQSLFNSFLITAPIPLGGVAPNSAFLRFASSWRPEGLDDNNTNSFPVGPNGEAINNQTAIIMVKYDNGAPIEVMKWDSAGGSPTFHPDAVNESVLVPLNNPAGATNMVLNFGLTKGANDWWWAIDNVVVSAGAAPPVIATQPVRTDAVEGQPVSLTVTATGAGLSYQWFKGQSAGKTAIQGATTSAYSLVAGKVSDNGYYSVEVTNSIGKAISAIVKLTVTPTTAGRLVLLNEDFNSLTLGSNVDEGINTPPLTGPLNNVWTKTPPSGWSIDDTGVPGAGDPAQDGVTEWAGWSFANRDFWANAGGQNRSAFTNATGAVAIADSDEWDDIGHASGNMATYLKTKSMSLQGVRTKSVALKFDSSWNPESPQKANVTVAFNGGTPVEIFRYESDETSLSFHPAELNETIAIPIDNPTGATNMVITFGYFETRNNWWYAIDNLLVVADPAPLFFEDFEGLALGSNVDEGIITGAGGLQTNVWTKTAPTGWSIDDTGVPGAGDPAQDGVTEWAGWSFAKLSFWSTAGGQNRSDFTKASGTVAVADSDEWDDVTHAAGNMATYLKTSSINIAGQAANTLLLKFDSSWRAEDPQKGNVTVSYDGGAPVEVLRWESATASPFFHDNRNESVSVPLNNPAGASAMRITFGYFDTRNNWWWAVDNIEVQAGAASTPGDLGRLNATVSGTSLNFTWTGGATTKLQKTTALTQPNWQDVPGTLGNNSATEPVGTGNAFYRLIKP